MDRILNLIKKIIPKKLFKFFQPAYHYITGFIAGLVYYFPSEKMIVIGVTGTTGKTTIVYLIAEMLKACGYKTGYTSTAMFDDGNESRLNDKKMTMVGRFFTQKMLKKMAQNGCQYAIVETTSEGIIQFRHRFINYDILVITGLYPEHIESHGGFENYKKAKGRLFAHLKKGKVKYIDENGRVAGRIENSFKKLGLKRIKKTIIANGNDEHCGYFLDFWAERKIVFFNNDFPSYSEKDKASGKDFLEAKNILKAEYGEIFFDGKRSGFSVKKFFGKNDEPISEKIKISLRLLGEFNAVNAMTAVCLGLSQDIGMEKIKKGLEKVSGAPGRMEIIDEGQDFTVIVDYAFEPRALEKLYEAVKKGQDSGEKGKIINILGSCGGGRDVARRPKLGSIAGKNADIVIVANEDPYDDDPKTIIDQVALGAEREGKKDNFDLFRIMDRREAIKKAIFLAEKNDIVLITGKGNEQAICIEDGKKIPWDDRAVAREEIGKVFGF